MDALEKLNQMVVLAERAAKEKSLQAELSQAVVNLDEAKRCYEDAGKCLSETRREHGDVEKEWQAKSKEIADLREKAALYKDYITEPEAILALTKEAEEELRQKYENGKRVIAEREQELMEARKAFDAALAKHKEVEQRLQAMGLEAATAARVESVTKRIDNLRAEIERTEEILARWAAPEQQAMLACWGGRARKLQDEGGLGEGEQKVLYGVFGAINRLCKQHTPGYVEALNRNFSTNWENYIASYEKAYRDRVAERIARDKDDEHRRVQDVATRERRQTAQRESAGVMEELQRLISTAESDPASSQRVREIVRVLIDDAGFDPVEDGLADLLLPLRKLFEEGAVYRALRRAFDRMENRYTSADFSHDFPGLSQKLAGKKAVLIGGSPREERRAEMQELLGLEELQWVSCEGKEPQVLERLADRARSGKLDYMIELVNFVGHHVETLKPVCDKSGCAFIRVLRGYGIKQVADSIQQNLAAMAAQD